MTTTPEPAPLADGIYHDMPDAEYHAIPRLSSSGVRNLLISPMTFWTRSWLNPDKDQGSTVFQDKGRAYHARVLEGREVFNSRYAYALNPADYPNALVKTDDLKAWIKAYIERTGVKMPLGGVKQQLIERILEADPGVEIWDDICKLHAEQHEGRKLLPHDWQLALERDAAFIERHPTIKNCFVGGDPEVTILWTHEVEAPDGSGEVLRTPMKARIDRLKANAIIDFKTYGNSVDKPILKAVAGAVAQGRYHVQAAVYYRCVDAAVKAGWIKPGERQFVFCFQGTGDDPTPIARIMDRRMDWIGLGFRQLDHACRVFNENIAKFGADPWLHDSALEYFADEDFPPWMADQ